ncbi:hypothetical protein DCAR_0933883 [Daucus carota subsp. sativus]|uniref:Bifunctional inhibitor/plant lipid transfer protein/seed storage helical domain-containing protein n=1 Tax=Daucus carota subsp. sativus TaxID=79200 RepID=A0AAF0XWZ0_DAUCS|nr:hypothetical protein DCAR_0933883 [Daucus carota subsp. sativus]
MANVSFILVMVLVVVASLDAGEASTFQCDGPNGHQQATNLCSPFSRRGQPEPSSECCRAYRAFVGPADTTEEKRQLCACVQRNARLNPANITRVDSLPHKCGTPVVFSADPKFDCNTYVFHFPS